MSKWNLLRSASMRGRRDPSNTSSIHHFSGHQLLRKKKIIWQGFSLRMELADENELGNDTINIYDTQLIEVIKNYFSLIDCPEYKLILLAFSINTIGRIVDYLKLWASKEVNFCIDSISDDIYRDKSSSLYAFELRLHWKIHEPVIRVSEFYKYDLDTKTIVVREVPKEKKIRVEDLLSNKLYGVDNTGNICVWPSESILLHTILSNELLCSEIRGKSVLEIGGGLTGLVGLGLAAHELCSSVTITDGHPICIANQNVCIEMCRSEGYFTKETKICSRLLEWSSWATSDFNGEHWDVILGSDCLFFRDFHTDLVSLLHGLLKDDGVIFLLQPSRCKSMETFAGIAEELFTIQIIDDYSAQVKHQRDEYESQSPNIYNPDIHFPLLLILRKKKPVSH